MSIDHVRATTSDTEPITRPAGDAVSVPGRFARELAAADDQALNRLRARAERAEAALAELRRDSARAILGLRRRVEFWRLVAAGLGPIDAAELAGLADIAEVTPLAGNADSEAETPEHSVIRPAEFAEISGNSGRTGSQDSADHNLPRQPSAAGSRASPAEAGRPGTSGNGGKSGRTGRTGSAADPQRRR
jgi:hypothetical protein